MGLISRVSSRTYRYNIPKSMGLYNSKPRTADSDDLHSKPAETSPVLQPPEKAVPQTPEAPNESQVTSELDAVVDEKPDTEETSPVFIDPRSPSANIQRTPVQTEATHVDNKLTANEPNQPQASTPSMPLREKRSIGNADNLRRRALMKQRGDCNTAPVDIKKTAIETELDPIENAENMSPVAEQTPIPKSPTKKSDMSILADELAGLGLNTPIAVKPLHIPSE